MLLIHQLSKKFKKAVPEFPKDVKADGHKEKMSNYLNAILANKDMREEPEVKRIFKLKQFYEQAEKEAEQFEVVMT